MMVQNAVTGDQQTVVNQPFISMRPMARFLQVVRYRAALPANEIFIAMEE